MWPFSRKERVKLDEFCGEFYDKNIFQAVVAGKDLRAVYFESVKRSIAEVDPRFGAIGEQKLLSEMTLIHLELFGLGWLHQLGDKHVAAQSAFTESYLMNRGRGDIWDAVEPYNKAIAHSSTLVQTSETRTGRAYLTFRNNMLADLFDLWHKQGFEPKPSARAANRLFTEIAWQKGLTAVLLLQVLCERLGCELNEEAQFRLVAVIRGLYEGIREALKSIKVEV
jgi:hypothetical protein